jgi:hypothetical protein
MDGARSKWLAWTGPLFVVGFAVIAFGVEGSTPGEKATAQHVVNFYNAHRTSYTVDALIGPLGAALLILFVSYVRSLARQTNAASGAGPTVLVAGGVLWASGLLFGSATNLALASSAHHHQNQIAQTLNVISNDFWIPFIAGIAITLIGAGMTVIGSRILPVWLGWVALVLGILSLAGPGGFFGFFGAPLFLLVAGVWLGVSKQTPAPAS